MNLGSEVQLSDMKFLLWHLLCEHRQVTQSPQAYFHICKVGIEILTTSVERVLSAEKELFYLWDILYKFHCNHKTKIQS